MAAAVAAAMAVAAVVMACLLLLPSLRQASFDTNRSQLSASLLIDYLAVVAAASVGSVGMEILVLGMAFFGAEVASQEAFLAFQVLEDSKLLHVVAERHPYP